MTAHVRQQIRDAIVAKLTGLTTTEDRCIVGRTRPLAQGYQPTLLVYTTPAASGGQETVRDLSMGEPRLLQRTMMVSVVGHINADHPPDDELDTVAAEVETALGGDSKLGGLVKDIILQSTVSQVDAAATRHEGAIRLVYNVYYFTRENAPTVSA